MLSSCPGICVWTAWLGDHGEVGGADRRQRPAEALSVVCMGGGGRECECRNRKQADAPSLNLSFPLPPPVKDETKTHSKPSQPYQEED